jgi:cytoskeletal protein CcmA (bactofilin family)
MRLILVFLFLFLKSWAAVENTDVEDKGVHILPANVVHEGDYFAWGDSIEISGTVNGDVYACGSQIIIDGTINGDVLAAGGSIDISGKVLHNIRIISGQVMVSGQVGQNATLVGGNVQLVPSSTIKGNLVCFAGNVDIGAAIDTNAHILASNLRLSGQVKKNVQAYVGQMRLTSQARIGGNLSYDSNNDAWVAPQAAVGGIVVHHPSLFHEVFKGNFLQGVLIGSKIAALLMNFLYSLVIGWILLRFYPKTVEGAEDALHTAPLKSAAYGLMLLIVLPLASLLLLMTILGAPFALTLLALNVIGFYTAKIFTIIALSNYGFKKINLQPNKMPSFTLGLIIYFGLTAIPILGTIIAFLFLIFGLGAVSLGRGYAKPLKPHAKT